MSHDGRVVVTEDLKKDYLAGAVTVHALRGVSVDIDQGEMVAIMGPSGSGKTTLLNLLGCVDRPSGGHYWLEGEDVSQMGDRALSRMRNEKIGFVFQTFNLLPRLNAADNVRLPLLYSYHRRPRQAPLEALKRVGLADRAHHRPSQLSGGEQQRVAIARALVMQPTILLADEPTGNLDSRSGEEIMLVFQRLNREGMTILIVTHDSNVAQHTSRIVHVFDGQITSDGPVERRLLAEEVLRSMPKRGAESE
ncbi:MAG: ATP-binding cassette domain-containing protein [Armatimonadetes bacterium]|nr:ATP-binding cassette domain-containing protein [Armatimonadota bacterium]NIM24585.1 ATP-binding cassette domain-containing protein [Armatimonadota bacterium]NIM68461.1 ATP-binding cassette domain-containing protein [Armatimonadota bacterium]NIM76847.1 ATP-binding cassette domain-containing protein [Armatimonadota bacterium]NIN06658.1 ATP-binding cassette domain-containing protein [Armatimonadota bacterium]